MPVKTQKGNNLAASWTNGISPADSSVSDKAQQETGIHVTHFSELGATGLKRYWDKVDDEWHAALRGSRAIKIYREMADNDPICGAMLQTYEMLLRGLDRNLIAADEQPIAQFYRDKIETMFDDMTYTWNETLSDILSMIWAGWSYHEEVYKLRRGNSGSAKFNSQYDDGIVGWRKWAIRSQDSLDGWEFADDGGVLGMYQRAAPFFVRTFIPIQNSLLFRTKLNKNNPEGRSLFRNAYRSWWFLKRIQEFEATGVEKDMAGTMKMELPVRYFDADATSDETDTIESFRQMVERARRGEYDGLVVPAEADQAGATGFKLSLMQSGGRRPIDVDTIIKRYESRIAVSMLGESVLLGMQGNVGSWSLASSKTHLMAMSLKAIRDTITDTINRYAIPRLMQANGWDTNYAPYLQLADIESDDAVELMNSLATAVGSGMITAGPELEKYLRARLGLPEEEDLTSENPAVLRGLDEMNQIENQGNGNFDDSAAQEVLQESFPAPGDDKQSLAMDLDDAADYLGISRNSIRNAISRGQIPGNKIGNQFRIMRQDLDRYMLGKEPRSL